MKFDYRFHVDRDWERYVAYLRRFRGNPKRILELGCGLGFFLEACLRNGVSAFGVEYEEEAIAECRAKGLEVQRYDLNEEMGFLRDESFDAVFSNQVIEHLPPSGQSNLVSEAFRVLEPGGQVLINSPCRHFDPARRDKFHIALLTPSELRALLEEHGFTDCNMGYNRPQKVDGVPEKEIKRMWDRYMPDLLSQSATVLARKPG